MKNLIAHPQFGEIRIRIEKGEPIFCAKDVCEILNYTDTETALRKLDEDEKLTRKIYASGQNRDMLFVNESGLYALIIRSNKPEARKFRKWVTAEVLPSIRKYGTYSTDEAVMSRAKLKAEQRTVKAMLAEVREHLSNTDIRLVAKQCRTSEYQVERVLRGDVKDTFMLQLLYARSTGNKILEKEFYTAAGAQNLMNELKNR